MKYFAILFALSLAACSGVSSPGSAPVAAQADHSLDVVGGGPPHRKSPFPPNGPVLQRCTPVRWHPHCTPPVSPDSTFPVYLTVNNVGVLTTVVTYSPSCGATAFSPNNYQSQPDSSQLMVGNKTGCLANPDVSAIVSIGPPIAYNKDCHVTIHRGRQVRRYAFTLTNYGPSECSLQRTADNSATVTYAEIQGD